MGYYTTHRLSIVSGNDGVTDYEQEITDFANYNYLFDDDAKWYTCLEDMKSYSKKHPNVVFCIDGEGEASDDVWKAYFKDGKMFYTKAIITVTFEDFSEDKLSN